MLKTGVLYGKYVHKYGIFFNKKNINIRKKTLKKLSFFKKISPDSKILEIGGTGQDAVAFAELGFDTTFIDLSKENVKLTKNFNKKKFKLKVINSDFLTYTFKQKFDVIRSRGVIHHTTSPHKFFNKVNYLLKNEGFFHFNLYRSGVFYYWFVENIRKISKTFNFKKFLKILLNTKISKSKEKKIGNNTIKSKSKFYNIIIDDLFVPILNPANYFDIVKDLKNLSFKIIKENKIKHRVDHDLLYPDFPLKKNHIVFDCQKKLEKKIDIFNYTLRKNEETKITEADKIINKNNELFKKIIKKNLKSKFYNKESFIKSIITLYLNCYLLSVKKVNKIYRHKKLENELLRLNHLYQ